jgi:ABC-type multidrug transport system fused ATPase/permease subunit
VRLYSRLLGYLRPYRGALAVAIACMVLYALTTTVSLSMVSPFMQVLFERPGASPALGMSTTAQADPARVLALAEEPLSARNLSHWPQVLRARVERAIVLARPIVALERICLFMLVMLFLKNVADYFQSYLVMRVEQAAIRDLRNDLHGHLQSLSLSFFHSRRTGMLISRVINDVEYLRNALASGISTLGKDVLTLAGALGLAFYASWRLTLLALLVLPVAATLLGWIGRTMRRRSTRAQERMSDLTAILHETITGARVVRAFGAERFETEKFRRTNQQFYDAYARMRRVALAARPFSEFALVLVALAMMWFGGREIYTHHTLAPHQFVLFVTALLTTVSPTKSVAEVSTNIQQGIWRRAACSISWTPRRRSATSPAPRCCAVPGGDPLRERVVLLPRWPHGAARRLVLDPPRGDRGAGGLERSGEEHGHGPAPAFLRPERRAHHGGWRRPAGRNARLAAGPARHRHPGDHLVPRHRAQQHRLRHQPLQRRGAAACRRGGARPRVRSGAAAGL